MTAFLVLVGAVALVFAFTTARAWIWAVGPIDTPPPRDVRLWVRIFAPSLHPAIERLWPR